MSVANTLLEQSMMDVDAALRGAIRRLRRDLTVIPHGLPRERLSTVLMAVESAQIATAAVLAEGLDPRDRPGE